MHLWKLLGYWGIISGAVTSLWEESIILSLPFSWNYSERDNMFLVLLFAYRNHINSGDCELIRIFSQSLFIMPRIICMCTGVFQNMHWNLYQHTGVLWLISAQSWDILPSYLINSEGVSWNSFDYILAVSVACIFFFWLILHSDGSGVAVLNIKRWTWSLLTCWIIGYYPNDVAVFLRMDRIGAKGRDR